MTGARYEGYFKDGLFDGKGTYISNKGVRREVQYKNGSRIELNNDDNLLFKFRDELN